MKIDFDSVLCGLDDSAVVVGDGPVKLATVATNALLQPHQGEQIDGVEKFERYKLAEKVNPGGAVEMTPEEVSKIKELIGRMAPPLIVGACYKILNGD